MLKAEMGNSSWFCPVGRAWPLDAPVRGLSIIKPIGRLKAHHGPPIVYSRPRRARRSRPTGNSVLSVRLQFTTHHSLLTIHHSRFTTYSLLSTFHAPHPTPHSSLRIPPSSQLGFDLGDVLGGVAGQALGNDFEFRGIRFDILIEFGFNNG
jgi:hypothetical protein